MSTWFFGSQGDTAFLQRITDGPEPLRLHDPEAYELVDRIYGGKIPVERMVWPELNSRPLKDEPLIQKQMELRRAQIIFDNQTEHAYKLVTLDFDGRRQPEGHLDPYEDCVMGTDVTEPWLVVDSDGRVIGIYVPDEPRMKVVLRPREPPILP